MDAVQTMNRNLPVISGVLHLDPESGWRGGQNQVFLLASGMAARGVLCHVAAPSGSPLAARLSGVIPVLPLPHKVRSFSLRTLFLLWKYCRQHHISILDCHSSRAHTLGILVKMLRPRLQLVVHRRVDFAPSSGIMGWLKYRSPFVARFVAISDAIAQVLLDAGIQSSRVAVVKSAVDEGLYRGFNRNIERQRLSAELGFDLQIPWIICGAAFTAQKDHVTLLRALKQVAVAGKSFVALLAGEGPLRQSCEDLARDLGLSAHVRFLGFRQDLPRLLAACDIMALSSRFEGLGTIVLDGFFAGCAVVATQAGGIPEMVRPGMTGWLVPTGDPEAFAAELLAALAVPELRRQYAEQARALARSEFSADAMVLGNIEVYRTLKNLSDETRP